MEKEKSERKFYIKKSEFLCQKKAKCVQGLK